MALLTKKTRQIIALIFIPFLSSCGMHEEKKVPSQQVTSPVATHPTTKPNSQVDEKATFQWIKTNVIDAYCVRCHNPSGKASDLPFTSYEEVMASGTVKATPNESTFYTLVDTAKMPPRQPRLNDELVKAIFDWISSGAQKN